MRGILGALALLLAGVAGASDEVHRRGEFEFAIGPVPTFVEPATVAEHWDPAAPGLDEKSWRVWLFEEQVDRRAGRDQVYLDYVWEARAASLLGSAGKFDITFNPNYQRLVIHRVDLRRGSRWSSRLAPDHISLARREADFEKNMADGNVTALIVLEDVRVDDVVRISYSIIGSNPILGGQIVDYNRFAWRSPMLDVRMRVLYEPGVEPLVTRAGNAPEATVLRRADATEVAVRRHGAAAQLDEGSYPVWYEPAPTVRTSLARKWSDVVAWALPLYPRADGLPADLEARLAQWSKLPDPQARFSAALRAVQDEVRYFGVEMGDNTHKPHAPSETWTRRYGDCKDKTYLLVTLLQRMGIEAAPALVSTTRGRGIADTPPAASVFNHVIVRAAIDGKAYWVDPTMTLQGGQARETDLREYGAGLVIAPGTQALETITAAPPKDAGILSNEHYELLADGGARLKVETVYRGTRADRARQSFAGESEQDRSRRYADHYRKRFGDLEPVTPVAVDDDRDNNVLKVTEHYLLRSPYEAGTGAGRALDVQADVLGPVATLPQSMDRSGPLSFAERGHYRHEIRVTMPDRWTSQLATERVDHASDAFVYSRDLGVEGRDIRVVYDLDVKQEDVGTAQLTRHLGELRKVRDSLYARLHMQVPGTPQERDAKLKALLDGVIDAGAEQ